MITSKERYDDDFEFLNSEYIPWEKWPNLVANNPLKP